MIATITAAHLQRHQHVGEKIRVGHAHPAWKYEPLSENFEAIVSQ